MGARGMTPPPSQEGYGAGMVGQARPVQQTGPSYGFGGAAPNFQAPQGAEVSPAMSQAMQALQGWTPPAGGGDPQQQVALRQQMMGGDPNVARMHVQQQGGMPFSGQMPMMGGMAGGAQQQMARGGMGAMGAGGGKGGMGLPAFMNILQQRPMPQPPQNYGAMGPRGSYNAQTGQFAQLQQQQAAERAQRQQMLRSQASRPFTNFSQAPAQVPQADLDARIAAALQQQQLQSRNQYGNPGGILGQDNWGGGGA